MQPDGAGELFPGEPPGRQRVDRGARRADPRAMIVFGQRLYGKMMQCGEAYVATRFFHVWFIPLIPLQSMVVTPAASIIGK